MQINYEVRHLKPSGQYKDRQEININGIPTMFMNGELEYLQELSGEDYGRTKEWCVSNLIPYMTRKSFNDRTSSYGLKHMCEADIGGEMGCSGWYVCNAAIKYILSELGYEHNPRWHYDINYTYQLS